MEVENPTTARDVSLPADADALVYMMNDHWHDYSAHKMLQLFTL